MLDICIASLIGKGYYRSFVQTTNLQSACKPVHAINIDIMLIGKGYYRSFVQTTTINSISRDDPNTPHI